MPDAVWQSMDLDLAGEIVDYKKKDSKEEFAGRETIDGKECFKIRITRKTGKMTDYFIDTKTYYIIQSTVVILKEGKKSDGGTSRFGDYRNTGYGTVRPFLLIQFVNGKVMMKTQLSLVETNEPVDEKIFDIPAS